MSQFIADPWRETNERLQALAARYRKLCHVISDNIDQLAHDSEPADLLDGEFPKPGSVAALLAIAPEYIEIGRKALWHTIHCVRQSLRDYETPLLPGVEFISFIAPSDVTRIVNSDGNCGKIAIPTVGWICGTIPVLPAEPCFLYADIDFAPDNEEVWGFDLETCHDRLASYAKCDGKHDMFLMNLADLNLTVEV